VFILLDATDIVAMLTYGLVIIKERVTTSSFSLIPAKPRNLNSRSWLHLRIFRREKAHIPEWRTVLQPDMREDENRIGTGENGHRQQYSVIVLG
jgi:hypothetical protein